MKNAHIIISDNSRFQRDIWQTESNFSLNDWNESIRIMRDNAKILYGYLSTLLETNESCLDYFDEHELYSLGDIINLLDSVDVVTILK